MSTSRNKSLRLHKAGHDPRAAALVALSRVFTEGADSQAALDGVLGSVHLMPSDKRLCTEIVYGTLRRYLRLKEFSERFLAKPDKLPDEMRLALITALYEMIYLRVPHHAPVGWAVTHVRNRFGKGLSGVTNGALRTMQRALKEFSQEKAPLHSTYSMPEWIVSLWTQSYGEDATLLLLGASQEAPPSGLRLNRARSKWESLRENLLQGNDNDDGQSKAIAVGASAIAYSGPLPWQSRELLKDGRASRQSAASYEALEALEPQSWPLPIWDCCSGRGGKTLALLEQGIAVALASDPSRQRLASLAKEYSRLRLSLPPCPPCLYLSASDSMERFEQEWNGTNHKEQLPDVFGTILVDAPCSGLGTLARHPEIRWRRSPEDLAQLTQLQKSILDNVWPRLAPGGQLVYITCTMNPAENQEQVATFLQAHPDAALQKEFQTPFDSPLHEFFYGARVTKEVSR